jgi:hypothetical protein
MIVTHGGHVNRFIKRTFTGEGGKKSMHYLPLLEYPATIAIGHLVASKWFPFYSAFTNTQKCEWLAWLRMTLFQTTFTYFYYTGWSSFDLGIYYVGHVVYDTLFLPFYRTDPLMYIHHIISGCVCTLTYWLGEPVQSDIHIAASMLERSNILLGVVWLLNRSGYGNTLLLQTLGGLALIVYIWIRMYLFPMYVLLSAGWTTFWLMSPFLPMNALWSWRLIKYYYHIAFPKNDGKERLE